MDAFEKEDGKRKARILFNLEMDRKNRRPRFLFGVMENPTVPPHPCKNEEKTASRVSIIFDVTIGSRTRVNWRLSGITPFHKVDEPVLSFNKDEDSRSRRRIVFAWRRNAVAGTDGSISD